MALSAESFFLEEMGELVNSDTSMQKKCDEGHTIDYPHNMSFNHSNIALLKSLHV